MLEEGASGEIADQRFVDRGAGKIEGGELLGERQAGNRDLVLDCRGSDLI